MLAGTMAVALIKMHLVICGVSILLGEGSAVEHVASHIPGVNNLISAAKTGNMANYVSASFFLGVHSDRATRYLQNNANSQKRKS